MTQDTFVVIDFIVRMGKFPRGVKKIEFTPLAERATKRMRGLLTETIEDKGVRVKAEHLGKTDKVNRRSTHMGSIVVTKPTMKDIMRIEDVLRKKMVGRSIFLKMRDAGSKKYLQVEVSDFRMSGASGEAWKPFTGWYKGAKALGLPL